MQVSNRTEQTMNIAVNGPFPSTLSVAVCLARSSGATDVEHPIFDKTGQSSDWRSWLGFTDDYAPDIEPSRSSLRPKSRPWCSQSPEPLVLHAV